MTKSPILKNGFHHRWKFSRHRELLRKSRLIKGVINIIVVAITAISFMLSLKLRMVVTSVIESSDIVIN